jgi:N-acetylglucosamine-6-phosphate deacetylase
MADRTGALRPGLDADLVVLDAALRVRAVLVAGTVVHGTLAADGSGRQRFGR